MSVSSVGSFAYMYVYVPTAWVPGAQGGHEGALGPLELESQSVVSHHRGAVNQTRVLLKSDQCS